MADWSFTTFADVYIGNIIEWQAPTRPNLPTKTVFGRVRSITRGDGGLHLHVEGSGLAIGQPTDKIEVYR